MLNKDRIPIGRLAQAFVGLNERNMEGLISSLPPESVYPYDLWREAYDASLGRFVHPRMIQNKLFESIPIPLIPRDDNLLAVGSTLEECANLALRLFYAIFVRAPYKAVDILDYLIEETDESDTNPFKRDRHYLIEFIIALEDRARDAREYKWEDKLPPLSDSPGQRYDFIPKLFQHTLVVDKAVAVWYCIEHDFPWKQEVKGLSRATYDRIIASMSQAPSLPSTDPSSEPELPTITIPRDWWQGKNARLIHKAVTQNGYKDEITAHILFHKRKETKKEIGEFFIGTENDESTCRRHANKLLGKTEEYRIIYQ